MDLGHGDIRLLALRVRYSLGLDRLGYDYWILLVLWIVFLISGVTSLASFYPMFSGYTIE